MIITKEDFKIWLNNPVTLLIYEYWHKKMQDYFDQAIQITYSEFFKEKKSEVATEIFAKCRGIQEFLMLIEESKEQVKLEYEAEKLPEDQEKPEIEDFITVEILDFIQKNNELGNS